MYNRHKAACNSVCHWIWSTPHPFRVSLGFRSCQALRCDTSNHSETLFTAAGNLTLENAKMMSQATELGEAEDECPTPNSRTETYGHAQAGVESDNIPPNQENQS